jgi:hypothetical protein
MSIYTETVELLTPGRRIFIRLLAAAVLAVLVYFAAQQESPLAMLEFLARHFHLVAGVAGVILLAFSDELEVEVSNEYLILRVGVYRKRYRLRGVSRASSAVFEPKSAGWFALQGWKPAFVSQVVSTGVELVFFDGKRVAFSSHNPDHLVSLIVQQAGLAQREFALRQVRASQ